ncbi:MAG: hypothetical protein R3275_09675 [Saprospiraceae bacterium]|nr:hypothetical protein [Saprospiraceae bacterium]
MKQIIRLCAVFFLAIGIQSCYYDNPPELLPFDCEDVSYSTHVQPIFNNSCATNGCHDGTTPPDLRSESSLNELRSQGYINLVTPEESVLYKTVDFQENPMPPGGPKLSQTNIDIILCWIEAGARNN